MGRRRALIVVASSSRPSPLLLCAAFAVAKGRPPYAPTAPVNWANARARQGFLARLGRHGRVGHTALGRLVSVNLPGGGAFYILMMPGSVRHNNSIYGRLARRVGQVGFRLVALGGRRVMLGPLCALLPV